MLISVDYVYYKVIPYLVLKDDVDATDYFFPFIVAHLIHQLTLMFLLLPRSSNLVEIPDCDDTCYHLTKHQPLSSSG